MNLKYLFFIFVMSFLLFSLYSIPYTLYPTFAQSPACSPQATNPRVQNGLISASDISGSSNKFANQSGTCAIDQSKIRFAPFKIPTYDDLKSVYYDQSKAAKVSLAAGWTISIAAETVYYRAGDLEVSASRPISGSGVGVFFVDGNLNISTNITFGSATEGLVFVVKGDINIDSNVTRVDAVLISQGTIYTAGAGCATSTVNVGSNALTINGNLVSLDTSKPIKLCRSLTDNNSPAERVIAQPKYLVILRNIYSETYQKWSEIQ